MDKKIIGAVFPDVPTTEKVVAELKRIGYRTEEISVFVHDQEKVNELENLMKSKVITKDSGRGKNSGRGAGIGAATGGFFGGIAGLAIGLGVLIIPGVGQIAAAGPILSALTGVGLGVGGGGVLGAIVGLGMPEEHAKQFEGFLGDGKIIVMVEVEESYKEQVYRTFIEFDPENRGMYTADREPVVAGTKEEAMQREE